MHELVEITLIVDVGQQDSTEEVIAAAQDELRCMGIEEIIKLATFNIA